jgi:hypothetical protein
MYKGIRAMTSTYVISGDKIEIYINVNFQSIRQRGEEPLKFNAVRRSVLKCRMRRASSLTDEEASMTFLHLAMLFTKSNVW